MSEMSPREHVDGLLAAAEAMMQAAASGHRRVGTIELHGCPWRELPLDVNEHRDGTTVAVFPGVFPLYTDGLVTYWMMPGQVIMGRHGDGLFTLNPTGPADGPVVLVPSKFFGPDEWAAFVEEDGGARYVVRLDEGYDPRPDRHEGETGSG